VTDDKRQTTDRQTDDNYATDADIIAVARQK